MLAKLGKKLFSRLGEDSAEHGHNPSDQSQFEKAMAQMAAFSKQLSLKVFKKNNFCLTDMLPTGPTSPCPEQLRALGGLWTCGYY